MLTRLRAGTGAALAGLILSLAPASCGGEREAPSEPPAELLRAAVENPAPSGVSEVALDVGIEGSSLLAGPLSVNLDGPFSLDAGAGLPSFDLALDAEVAGFGVDGALVSTGTDAFVAFFGETYRVGPESVAAIETQLSAAGEEGPGLGLGIDEWFQDPRYAGVEEVAGAETERIEGALDTEALAADLADLAEAVGAPPLLRELAAAAGEGSVEAWVAFDDHTIRRLRAQFPFTVAPARRSAAGGVTAGLVALDAEISDVGADVSIEPPPGGGFQPIEDLIGRLRDLASLGGL